MMQLYLMLHQMERKSSPLARKLILAALPAQTLKVERRPPVAWVCDG